MTDRTPQELISQIWDTEEKVGITHYLQTREQFVQQMSFKSIDELMVRLGDAEKAIPEVTPNYVNELIHIQFESCKEHFGLDTKPEVYDSWNEWFDRYVEILPLAFQKDLISEDQVYTLLERVGDYLGGYETEEEFTNFWLPYNSILECN
jgi:hypothetical protein